MLFTIGVEVPKNDGEAFGLVVPALCTDDYSCFSGADNKEDIIPMVTEAIHLTIENMVENNIDLLKIKDLGFMYYKQQEDFAYCDTWLLVDIDITAYFGKRQRVNVVLPQYLLDRIDQRIMENPSYKDRSHFLAIATKHELENRV